VRSGEEVIVKPTQSIGDSDQCLRCRGLTVLEDLCGGMAGAPGWELTVRRCVICGDVVDPVILQHRAVPMVRISDYEAGRDVWKDDNDAFDEQEEE
jgi:hypothetical protein